MIVEPDFFDHWRTRMLVDLLGGDEMAPIYVQRVWGHCQLRKAVEFSIPAVGLKALCKYSGDAEKLEDALIKAGFVERNDGKLCVPKWAEYNSGLLANWQNGAMGGRPKKPNRNPTITQPKPTGNPTVTQREPIHNPTITQSKPNHNPTETHWKPIREDKRREEKKEESPLPPSEKPKPENQANEPDRLIAAQDAKKLAEKYRRMIAHNSTPGNGQAEILSLLMDQCVQVEQIERAIKNFAEWRNGVPDAPFPPHAKTFFGSGQWLEFRDGIPEHAKPPDPYAEERAQREARDAEWRRLGDIATQREIEELNASAERKRKGRAALAGG